MNPVAIDNMSWAMAEVYGAVTDRLLANIARHFKFTKADNGGTFKYMAEKLAELGQVRRESVDIITQSLSGGNETLRVVLENAIVYALKDTEPALRKAAQKGILGQAGVPELAPNQMQAFQAYYRQSADKLNLVNTVMLESTEAAYRSTVSDIVARVERTQSILNAATGEVVTGASSWNTAVRDAVKKMADNGLTGFIDHAGHRWRPETYVAMDVRTTAFNTARAAVWERNESYGNDLYQVSSHNGARPLCYPWQGKVISSADMVREVEDLDGNTVHVYAQSETSYGQPAGLFGVNCGHYPIPFIPGISRVRSSGQDPEDNAKTYAESQQQRELERKLRQEKLDLDIMKAQGADEETIRAQKQRVRTASTELGEFCDKTGRTRHRDREGKLVNAGFPAKESYNPMEFPTEQRDKITDFFAGLNSKDQNAIIDLPESAAESGVVMGHTPERRTYGKTTAMNYSATLGDEITLSESGRQKDKETGAWVDFSADTKVITVRKNESESTPLVYQLPSGAKSFLAQDETQNTIMSGGRVAINYATGNNDTRARVREMLENEIDILGGVRKDGIWYRVTSNEKDAEYIKTRSIRPSVNHATGETEAGLSVWERPKYFDKYMERVSGDVVGIGADGEPLLDVNTVTLLESIDIQAARDKGKSLFLETYGWTYEQLDAAITGKYKVTR